VTTISQADLEDIWDNTLNCNLDGTTGSPDSTNVSMDWRCLELAQGVQTPASLTANGEGISGPAEPIDCYTSQTASGTYSTWNKFLGSFSAPPPCASDEASGTSASHTNITENQMATVDAASDAQWAIYFMSYGKFTQICDNPAGNTDTYSPVAGQTTQIQGTCQDMSSSDVAEYGGIGFTNSDAYADSKTIQGNGDLTGVTFLDPRTLWNAYPNSTAPNPASAATLNFIGAGGFLCRADMKTAIDPNSGATYRNEIESAIIGDGFFPLDLQSTQATFTEPTLTTASVPSAAATTAYYPGDSSQEGGDAGYCTDSN
jgi:hypothetical protein